MALSARSPLLLVALLALLIPSGASPGVVEPGPRTSRAEVRTDDPQPVDLADLRAHPLRYRGVRVALTVQLGDERESWSPGLTRFDTKRFRGFAAWSDDARLWHPEPFADPLPGLYARRSSPAARALSGAGSYGRLELVAVVRAVFGGELWIEVLEATRMARSVGEGSLIHGARAVELSGEEHFAAAAAEYERALAAPLPEGHRMALEEERDRALKRAEG